ncbi:hypothetical protein NC651_016148 [Populus alba x Populus x berolinensis]|nr:hypothetical protein NC651_016148 [Populus alba x Populus x berolinensis]
MIMRMAVSNLEEKSNGGNSVVKGNHSIKCPMFQMMVCLRTNCIDCLDRTKCCTVCICAGCPWTTALMLDFMREWVTQLRIKYGGSAAHNKIFSERRGQWKAATQSQEFFRTLQRYYNNAYMDAEKQDAINVWPICSLASEILWLVLVQGKNSWGTSNHNRVNLHSGSTMLEGMDKPMWNGDARSIFKRSLSDGNILRGSGSPLSAMNVRQQKFCRSAFPDQFQEENNVLSESSPEISTCESDIAFSRYTPSMPRRQLFRYVQRDRCLESDHVFFSGRGDTFNCSNFVDIDWLSSSGNSCEEEPFESIFFYQSCGWIVLSSLLTNYPIGGLSSENVNGIMGETTPSTIEYGSSMKESQQSGMELSYSNPANSEEFSDSFVQWVNHGETLPLKLSSFSPEL